MLWPNRTPQKKMYLCRRNKLNTVAMKKLIVFALAALIFAACGGPSASFSKEYNLTEKHPQTKKAYEMVKKDLSMSRVPGKWICVPLLQTDSNQRWSL